MRTIIGTNAAPHRRMLRSAFEKSAPHVWRNVDKRKRLVGSSPASGRNSASGRVAAQPRLGYPISPGFVLSPTIGVRILRCERANDTRSASEDAPLRDGFRSYERAEFLAIGVSILRCERRCNDHLQTA